MKISDSIELTIKQFDDKFYPIQSLSIIEGINGVIPQMVVTISNFNDTVDDEEVDVKLIVGENTVLDTKGFIIERQVVGDKALSLKCYLLPKDFIYTRKPNSFDNLDDVISALWSGDKENIPSGTDCVCNQCMEESSSFLTKVLLCLKSDFAFAYEASGKLRGIDLSKENTDIELGPGKEFSIVDKTISAKYNPLQDIEEADEDIMATSVIVSNVVRFTEKDAVNVYVNYTNNKARFLRMNQKTAIEYFNYGAIRIGDVVELAVSGSLKQKYRAIFNDVRYINKQWKVITQLALINE